MADGPLFFPITPFTTDGRIDTTVLRDHLYERLAAEPGAVFAACGTGEMHALDVDEIGTVADAAVRAAAGRVPVYVGAGGPLPTALAIAAAARAAGADGLLLMPPYLVAGNETGLADYVGHIVGQAGLPVVLYQRGSALFTPSGVADLATLPGVIGFKDGHGDLELMQRTVLAVRARIGSAPFQFFNGLPTAELTQRAYRAIGVDRYSSAVFAFAPEIARACYQALQSGDDTRVDTLLTGFYAPIAELRRRVPGYAVSLVKAGVALRGLPVGGVRPPLSDPTDTELDELGTLLDHGLALAAGMQSAATATE